MEKRKIGKQPYYFTRLDNRTMFIAVVYKNHQFLVIIMQTNSNAIDIHHWLSVIINEEDLNDYYNFEKKSDKFFLNPIEHLI